MSLYEKVIKQLNLTNFNEVMKLFVDENEGDQGLNHYMGSLKRRLEKANQLSVEPLFSSRNRYFSAKLVFAHSKEYGYYAQAQEPIARGELLIIDTPIAKQQVQTDVSLIYEQFCRQRSSYEAFIKQFIKRFNGVQDLIENYAIELRLQGEQVIALFPLFSLLNHSCDASAIHYERDNHMIIKACKDIAKREQVFINYFPGFEFTYPEREERCEHFGFECSCELCLEYSKFDECYHIDDNISWARQEPIHYFPLMMKEISLQLKNAISGQSNTNIFNYLQILCCESLDYTLDDFMKGQFEYSNPNEYNLDLLPIVIRTARKCNYQMDDEILHYYRRLVLYLYDDPYYFNEYYGELL